MTDSGNVSKRTWLWAGLLLLTGSVLTALFLVPWFFDTYVDGFSIHQPSREAFIREILWENPERLQGKINADGENYEPQLTADGLTLIFTRGKALHNADLYQSRWNGRDWGEPTAMEVLNSDQDELGPEISSDGRYLYFYSNRPGGLGGFDIWLSARHEDQWTEPVNLGPTINSEFNEYGPGLSPDSGTLFFSSNRSDRQLTHEEKNAWQATLRENFHHGDYDLFSAKRLAKEPLLPEGNFPPLPAFAHAQRLEVLNSTADEGQVAMTPRGDFIYFSSNRKGGLGGFDIYRSRILFGEIGQPENMGRPLNSVRDDMDPALTLEGHGMLLSSNRLVQGKNPSYQIFRSVSREVFIQKDFSGLAALFRALDRIKWPLLFLLLGLLALLYLLRYLKRQRVGLHGSLLQKCLLLSLLLHLLLALLTSTWIVTSSLYDLSGEDPGTLSLNLDALSEERLGLDIREEVADLERATAPSPEETRDERIPSLEKATLVAQASPNHETKTDFHIPSPMQAEQLKPIVKQETLRNPASAAELEPMPMAPHIKPLAQPQIKISARAPDLQPIGEGKTPARTRVVDDLPAVSADLVAPDRFSARPGETQTSSPELTAQALLPGTSDPLFAPSLNQLPPMPESETEQAIVMERPTPRAEPKEAGDPIPLLKEDGVKRSEKKRDLDHLLAQQANALPRQQVEEPRLSDRSALTQADAARTAASDRSDPLKPLGDPAMVSQVPEVIANHEMETPSNRQETAAPTLAVIPSPGSLAQEEKIRATRDAMSPPLALSRETDSTAETSRLNQQSAMTRSPKGAPLTEADALSSPQSKPLPSPDPVERRTLPPMETPGSLARATTLTPKPLRDPSQVGRATSASPIPRPPLSPLPDLRDTKTPLIPLAMDLPSPSEPPIQRPRLDPFTHQTPPTYHGLEMTSKRVVFCLDLSNSMEWNNRIGEARAELLRLLDTLDESVHFNIVTFSGRARAWNRRGVQPGAEELIQNAKNFVRNARIGADGTNTVDALSLALADEEVDSIFFLSDGHPTAGYTTDPERILKRVQKLKGDREVKIHTIAYVKGDPPPRWRNEVPPKSLLVDLMRRLADENSGNFVLYD